MDNLVKNYQEVIEKLLKEYEVFLGEEENVQIQLIFDQENHHYLLAEAGWNGIERIYGTLIHLDIIDDKIWIQHDGTESGVAYELMEMGISQENIVLGFKSLERRKITDFAVC